MRLLILQFLLVAQIGFAQSFEKKFQFLFPGGTIQKLSWVDINNDSLLDVVVSYKTLEAFKLTAFENKLNEVWPAYELVSVNLTAGATDEIDYQLADYNKDGLLDIVIKNELVHLVQHYRNSGSFQFATDFSWGNRVATLKELFYVDLNNNAVIDTIWSDGVTLHVTNQRDTTLNKIESICVTDFDNNGFRDVAFSGTNTDNQSITFIWYLGNYFKIIDRELVTNQSGHLSTGDLNHDGRFDLIVTGKSVAGVLEANIYENSAQGFAFSRQIAALENAEVWIADFSSDGVADISFRGVDNNAVSQNWLEVGNSHINLLPDIGAQAFGDYDRDGDLDWVYTKGDSLHLFSNEGNENFGPSAAFRAMALSVYNKLFFYWDKPTDDHTTQSAITYDLKIFSADSTILPADFREKSFHRVKPSHGNRGTNNFALFNFHPGESVFEIQTIDNAFMSGNDKTICRGGLGGGSGASCEVASDIQEIVVCGDAPVVLTPPAPDAMWFSFSKGFMGVSDSFTADIQNDTIFSFNPTGPRSCASLRIYKVKVNPVDTIYNTQLSYHCQGDNELLEIATEWTNVTWRNNKNTNVVNAQFLNHLIEQDVIITAMATNAYGCVLKETHQLLISLPVIQLNGDHFQIVRGSEIQLGASGGETFLWRPSGSLNNHLIFNPIASPEETTEYQVVVTDSIGCTAAANILVEVFEEAFIPTMFTPNGDGRNDMLKIYGLIQASGFKFEIFNREGNRLFATTNISDATQSGWGGQVNGVSMPPGTYYWKVEGKMPKGELLLNGKKNGAFLLIR